LASTAQSGEGPAPKVFRPAMLEIGHRLCDLSREAVLPHFRTSLVIDNKDGNNGYDPVTIADRAAEKAIRDELLKVCPQSGIVGEEFGTHQGDAKDVWVVDPIDGTRAFITGSPLWGTLIGLVSDGQPELGLMDQPFTGERFWSGAGQSYWRGPRGDTLTLTTRTCPDIASAVLATTHPDLFATGREAQCFERVKSHVRMSRYGGDCYGYAMLASGFVDVIVEAGLKSFDIAALIPIIEHAGGRVTTWDGRPATEGGQILACGDPRLHDVVLDLLNTQT